MLLHGSDTSTFDDDEKPRLDELLDVVRDRPCRSPERVGELGDCCRPFSRQVDDVPTQWVRQRLELVSAGQWQTVGAFTRQLPII